MSKTKRFALVLFVIAAVDLAANARTVPAPPNVSIRLLGTTVSF